MSSSQCTIGTTQNPKRDIPDPNGQLDQPCNILSLSALSGPTPYIGDHTLRGLGGPPPPHLSTVQRHLRWHTMSYCTMPLTP